MIKHKDDVILTEIKYIRESQLRTEEQLVKLNGKVASHEKKLNFWEGIWKGAGLVIGVPVFVGAVMWIISFFRIRGGT